MGIHYGKADFINYGKPSLLLDFARNKSLVDRISGNNLITFERASIGTYVGADGLIKYAAADEARFDYDPETGESLGLLIEESRTNLFPYSENFSPPAWGNYNVTLTPNATQSPNGNSNATKIAINSGQSDGNVSEYVTGLSVGQYYTESIFLKQSDVGWDYVFVWYNDTAGWGFTIELNLTNGNYRKTYEQLGGRYSDISWKVEPYPNGWYKISLTAKKESTGSTVQIRLYPSNNPHTTGLYGTQTVTGADGTKGCYVWGAQLEQGSFSTSYIPTSGSTFTRQPDKASITGSNFSSWYNQNEGSILYESALTNFPNSLTYRRLFSINSGTGSQDNVIHFISDENNNIVLSAIWNNSSPQYTQYSRALSNYVANDLKLTIGYKDNDVRSYMESAGFLDTVGDSSVTIPKSMVKFDIGNINGGNLASKQHIKKISYYPTRLTNTQLQELTQ